jgi:tetratricopeptide (TPR) repeat protein
MYSGLSLAHGEVGELNQSAYYAQRAITIHETLNDRISLARSENNLGLLLLKKGDLTGAEEHIKRGYALFIEAGVEVGRAAVLLSLSELAIATSRLDEAEKLADEAREFAGRLSEKATVANAHMWLGRIAVERGDPARVDTEFREALGILDAIGASDRLSQCHAEYAEVLEKRGDLAAANQQLHLALRRFLPARPQSMSETARTANG